MSSASAVYAGTIRHRRFVPARHEFRYRAFLPYLDLAELPDLFDGVALWSARRPAPAWFRSGDFLPGRSGGPEEAARDLLEERTGARPRGPVRLLAHLRYFGHIFNPVSFYYVFPEMTGGVAARPEAVIAEITNTPWKERHCYVLTGGRPESSPEAADAPAGRVKGSRHRFRKDFHVSPFFPMEQEYRWFLGDPGERLVVHMENHEGGVKVFDATMDLERRPFTAAILHRALLRHPLMTLEVVAAIHWQAFRLWRKRVPFHSHPSKRRIA